MSLQHLTHRVGGPSVPVLPSAQLSRACDNCDSLVGAAPPLRTLSNQTLITVCSAMSLTERRRQFQRCRTSVSQGTLPLSDRRCWPKWTTIGPCARPRSPSASSGEVATQNWSQKHRKYKRRNGRSREAKVPSFYDQNCSQNISLVSKCKF